MKNRILLVFSFIGLMAIGAGLIQQLPSFFQQSQKNMETYIDNKDLWKQVDSLAAQGLPQSALELVNRIYLRALKAGDMPEFLKAAIYQLRFRSEFEEDYIPKYIAETEKSLSTTPTVARHVLHSILADLYWQYYQQNRYRILNQTTISDNNDADIDTWDAKMFVNKASAHYLASLKETSLLQSVSLKIYDPVLQTAEGSKKFRPTLFDFLSHRAIDFFRNEEASITRPVNPFVMKEKILLALPDQFITHKIKTSDSISFYFHAISMLQQVEAFHFNDRNPEALVDASLKRLEFVRKHINLSGKDSAYLSTLTLLGEQYSGIPVYADIIEKIAAYWYGLNERNNPIRPFSGNRQETNTNYITARSWCLKAIEKYPDSDGAKNCRVILQAIEEPSLSFNIDQEVAPAKAFPVLLNFRNTKTVWFRLLNPDYDNNVNLRQELYGERGIDKYLAMKPLKEWSITLPVTSDYRSHAVEVIIPAIEPGYYALLVSGTSSFDRGSSPLAAQDFWSTAISYISKRNEDGSGLFYLLDRNSGQPLQEVKVQSFSREYNYQDRSYVRRNYESFLTGTDGSFLVKSASSRDYSTLSFDFSIKNDRLVIENYFSRYRGNEPQKGEKLRTFFFTDRSIYRPGQPVFFKGIVIGTDVDQNRVVSDHKSTVNLYDVNGQKISSLDVVSNSFGSFSGSFMLQASGLGGQFRIENSSGNTYFQVEEYKRPKFAVTFLPVMGSYRLNEKVSVSGKAEGYTGVPVSDAAVSYRVVRSAFFPYFRYGWKMWPGMMTESEISNGSMVTKSDGTFMVDFTALPDPTDFGDLDPVYNFTVYADVTDINGETRSSVTSVQVSAQALILGLDLPVTLNRDEAKSFRLTTTNLNGKRTPAEVTVEAFRLMDDARLTRQRRWNDPDLALYTQEEFIKQLPTDEFMGEHNKAVSKGKSVFKDVFNTANDSLIKITGLSKWEPGRYLVTLSAVDAFGEKITSDKEIIVFSPASKRIPVKQAFWADLLSPEVKPGQTIRLLAGSAAKNVRILLEVQLKGKPVKQEWITFSQDQKLIEFQVPPEYYGNVTLSLTMVSDNRSYSYNTTVNIPDTRHQLNIAFETFRSPLLPGGTEKWKLKMTAMDGLPVPAELLAGMYDASLNAFMPHNWYFQLVEPWVESFNWENIRSFETATSYSSNYNRADRVTGISRDYDQLNWFGYNMFSGRIFVREMQKGGILRNEAMAVPDAAMQMDETAKIPSEETISDTGIPNKSHAPEPMIRRNLNETAFFYPQLTTNEKGEVMVEFMVPEALTKWNFLGLAHTKDLCFGQFTKEVVTRKELMVTPNLPRFFREGDFMVIQTKVSNLTSNPVQGDAKLQLFDALTLEPVDLQMKNLAAFKVFDLEPGGNAVVHWEIAIPGGIDAVMVRITAQAGNYSDGEESLLPVLTNRMLVTETLSLPVNGNEDKSFTFSKLLNQANASTTLHNHRLTLEFTSNPAWYAVQALPYLAENTNENIDQVFNRFYANNLAAYIANSSPKIRAVFETWKNLTPDALLSNLEKNQDLKSLLLEETPWLMEARNESARKQHIALMFDLNRMAVEKEAAGRKLVQSQSSNGGWPWFEGMPESRYITRLIVTGFGKLHYLKVIDLNKDEASRRMVQQAVNYLGIRLNEDYERIMKDFPDEMDKNHINQDHIQYLYAMSYLGDVIKPAGKAEKAIAYFSGQARKYWTNQGLYTQGMIALWAGRCGNDKTTAAIMKSMRERSLKSDEMGMYWRDNRSGWFWYEAPVETQALLIELFEELGNDPRSVDQMKTWLLKQKQTQSWPTSRSTADAVYALLLRGGDWLQTGPSVMITLGGKTIDPAVQQDLKTEAGTGYFKMAWSGQEIQSQMGNVSVAKSTEGPAWGALYWQYFEDLDKVSAHDSPLKIIKQLYIKRNTGAGPVLEAISDKSTLMVGQQMVVRVELRTDRDLEYVHLKDMRAAGFEPVNTLSGYRWNGGLGYYENTRDAATNFFFSWLPKGTWVFEYPLVVSQKGEFSNGVTSVQCMYAPEFAAHSEGIRVLVR
ncbi:MAG: alpha-2-macroglobulin family protein [Bacteroidota bacterium]